MAAKGYQVDAVDAASWDAFVEASPQGTVFNQSRFLAAYQRPVQYMVCRQGDDPVAGLALVGEAGSAPALPYHHYGGLLYRRFSDVRRSREQGIKFRSAAALAETIFDIYDTVFLHNHWEINDLRPFQWINYHDPDAGQYDVDVRYTALMPIDDPVDLTHSQELRRRSIRKAKELGVSVEASTDWLAFRSLQQATFDRQDVSLGDDRQGVLDRVYQAFAEAGQCYLAIAAHDGSPAYGALFLVDRFRGYFLAGGGTKAGNAANAGSLIMLESMRSLHREFGVQELDFVGANSPNRGDFKLSFGSVLKPCFVVRKGNA